MTARERAAKTIHDNRTLFSLSCLGALEQAITAAITEDRKSRKCCKAERDECAEIAKLHEKSEMVKAKNAERLDKKWEEAGHLFEANAARFIEAEIRARATTSPADTSPPASAP